MELCGLTNAAILSIFSYVYSHIRGCLCEKGGCRSVKCTLSAGFLMFTILQQAIQKVGYTYQSVMRVLVLVCVIRLFLKRGHRFVGSF